MRRDIGPRNPLYLFADFFYTSLLKLCNFMTIYSLEFVNFRSSLDIFITCSCLSFIMVQPCRYFDDFIIDFRFGLLRYEQSSNLLAIFRM